MTPANKIMATLAILLLCFMIADVANSEGVNWYNGFDMFAKVNQKCVELVMEDPPITVDQAIPNYYSCMSEAYWALAENAQQLVDSKQVGI